MSSPHLEFSFARTLPSLRTRALLALLAVACSSKSAASDPNCPSLPADCAAAAALVLPKDGSDGASGTPSYSADVFPILDARCNTCHFPSNPDQLWPLNNFINISDWSALILRDLQSCAMPPKDSGALLAESERRTLNAWLVCGAPHN